jgi:hypothetical protein
VNGTGMGTRFPSLATTPTFPAQYNSLSSVSAFNCAHVFEEQGDFLRNVGLLKFSSATLCSVPATEALTRCREYIALIEAIEDTVTLIVDFRRGDSQAATAATSAKSSRVIVISATDES